MIWYSIGAALTLLVYAWGLGLAILVLPARWRRFWPALTPACGLALQSLVVWCGAHAGLPGVQNWAVYATILPMLLLALARWRVGGVRR